MLVALFLVREVGLEPTRSPIRPLNARVCRFRHSRKCKYKYIANLHFCQSIMLKKLHFVKRFNGYYSISNSSILLYTDGAFSCQVRSRCFAMLRVITLSLTSIDVFVGSSIRK